MKLTRTERHRARQALWKQHVEEQEAYAKAHPVLSGRVKVVDYVEPYWRYVRPQPIKNGIEVGL